MEICPRRYIYIYIKSIILRHTEKEIDSRRKKKDLNLTATSDQKTGEKINLRTQTKKYLNLKYFLTRPEDRTDRVFLSILFLIFPLFSFFSSSLLCFFPYSLFLSFFLKAELSSTRYGDRSKNIPK